MEMLDSSHKGTYNINIVHKKEHKSIFFKTRGLTTSFWPKFEKNWGFNHLHIFCELNYHNPTIEYQLQFKWKS